MWLRGVHLRRKDDLGVRYKGAPQSRPIMERKMAACRFGGVRICLMTSEKTQSIEKVLTEEGWSNVLLKQDI